MDKDGEEVRIRVISNSNNPSDVIYKEEVVKYLKEEILIGKELNKSFLKDNQFSIEQKLNEVFDDVKVYFKKHTFKDKTYNGSVLKEKAYDTLLIVIGDGMGENWWGSIFDNNLQKESTDEVVYEWYLK